MSEPRKRAPRTPKTPKKAPEQLGFFEPAPEVLDAVATAEPLLPESVPAGGGSSAPGRQGQHPDGDTGPLSDLPDVPPWPAGDRGLRHASGPGGSGQPDSPCRTPQGRIVHDPAPPGRRTPDAEKLAAGAVPLVAAVGPGEKPLRNDAPGPSGAVSEYPRRCPLPQDLLGFVAALWRGRGALFATPPAYAASCLRFRAG